MWLDVASLAAFSPTDLKASPTPAAFDTASAKPASMSWRDWCDPPSVDDMDVPLSNHSLRLQRDTPWLQMRAATLDALEFAAPKAVPSLWRPGSSLLDVGAASGELTRFIARKYGLSATALDVAAPENNSFAKFKQRLGAWPVRVFDGTRLPAASGSFDVVLFVYSLHHAGPRAPALLREAARVARHSIVVIEACDVLDEAAAASSADARRAASETRAREFPCMGDRQAVFRTQREWTTLLEDDRWRVTRVGAVRESREREGSEVMDAAHALRPPSVFDHRRWFVSQRR